MLSEYCIDIANNYNIIIGNFNRLVPNLSNISKYVLHYKHLQVYLSLGMKLISIQRILSFKQSIS